MTVTIGSMVLVAILTVYSRAMATSASIDRNLGKSHLPGEILQLIAEDLDPIMTAGTDTKISINSKIIQGYPSSRLEIRRTILDAKGATKEFETIVWQASYDYESDANGLVLYRMHSGLLQEDKLLDDQRQDLEALYPMVPICEGVTYFSIQVPVGDKLSNKWPPTKMPPGVIVTVSFSEPFETEEGTIEILEEDKFERTIAINRTRKMTFKIEKPVIEEDTPRDEQDPNDMKSPTAAPGDNTQPRPDRRPKGPEELLDNLRSGL
jgi:hypothetical protein